MSEEERDWCEKGSDWLERGEPEEALECFERALQADPDDPEAWCGHGKACYDLGRLERADRDFRRAQRCAQEQLGPLEGKITTAKRWWSDTKTRPYLRALHGRGLCRFWLGDYEDAARLFRRLLKLAPSDPLDVRFLIGETYFRMGQVDKAVDHFKKAGEDPDALYNLGLAYFYRGEFIRSVNALRRAMFENLYLAARMSDSDVIDDIPSYRGTHPKGLDGEEAAVDYDERCGDLWRGRPLLRRWLRSIYEHPAVRADIMKHVAHLRRLADESTDPKERARLEGENTSLRSETRLAQNDRAIAQELAAKLFKIE